MEFQWTFFSLYANLPCLTLSTVSIMILTEFTAFSGGTHSSTGTHLMWQCVAAAQLYMSTTGKAFLLQAMEFKMLCFWRSDLLWTMTWLLIQTSKCIKLLVFLYMFSHRLQQLWSIYLQFQNLYLSSMQEILKWGNNLS